jgi:hypothetical protein
MPISIAKQIAADSDRYPRDLVHLAVERCHLAVTQSVTPLLDVADRQKWFDEP